jgi:predicted dehydrogenase
VDSERPHVAVVGAGYWGSKLVRNLANLPSADLVKICDLDPEVLASMESLYPRVEVTGVFENLLHDEQIDGIVLATDAATHFDLARQSLEAGKHTFVEKPLALSIEECDMLINLARSRSLILMVGHVFLYNASVRRVRQYIEGGELGDVMYIYAQRLNLGRIRSDLDALWNLGPHDLSILSYWLDAEPERVRAKGYSYVQPNIADVIFLTLDFPGEVGALVHLSWLDPNKTRKITVVGTKKMLIYDDTNIDAPLRIVDKGVDRLEPNEAMQAEESFAEFKHRTRTGDITIPKIEFTEPLAIELESFARSIVTGEPPVADGENGAMIVRALSAASKSMSLDGATVRVPSRKAG